MVVVSRRSPLRVRLTEFALCLSYCASGARFLVCGGGVVAPGSTTDPAPFSAAGDFEVRQTLTLPQPCRGLVVLVGRAAPAPGAPLAAYFALSGLPD